MYGIKKHLGRFVATFNGELTAETFNTLDAAMTYAVAQNIAMRAATRLAARTKRESHVNGIGYTKSGRRPGRS